MSLQLIYGTADKARSRVIVDGIRNKIKANPFGKPIFYIAPEQMTFQQEVKLFETDELAGSTRAQVMSFSRLAYRVLQETGGATKQFISSTGIQMMLRKIIMDKDSPFEIFNKAIDKYGFLGDLETLITELKRHCITPQMLDEYMTFTQENEALYYKLQDINYIYHQLMYLFQDKYVDGEDQLQLLVDKMEVSTLFQDADIYIDGFYRFTPKELAIVEGLLKHANQVTIMLTMDNPATIIEELDLFYQTKTAYQQIIEIAKKNQIKILDDYVLSQNEIRFQSDGFIAHLEQHFSKYPLIPYDGQSKLPLKVMEAVHPRAEIEGVIQEVLRLTRDEGYRYKDMVIYLRDDETYADILQTMFIDYQIPIFIDAKRSMLNHSLVEFIRSLLEAIESDFRSDTVFRLLKTGYFKATDENYPLTMDAIDELENYCLEYGIRKKSQWFQLEDWTYRKYNGFERQAITDEELAIEAKINAYRRQFTHPLSALVEQMALDQSAKAMSKHVFMLFEAMLIPEQLENKMYQYEQAGQLQKAREEEQVWQGVIQLLDEIVEMIGEEVLDFKTFKQTIEAGLEALEFSHVPPSLDYVIVASIDRSRIDDKKCGFLLGVNEGYWPMSPGTDGMITEKEREFLKAFDIELAASNRRVLLDDQLYMYIASTTATEKLWVSYPISDEEGHGRMPAQLIHQIQELFPTQHEFGLLTDPDELYEATRFLTTPEKSRTPLVLQLSRYLKGYPMDEKWLATLRWYIENEEKWGNTYKVLQSLFYENIPKKLTEETTIKLHPQAIKTSVSRLETFYKCSYQHFANYHLKLKNRKVFKLEAPDMGQLFHEALKIITEDILAEKENFKDVSKDEAKKRAHYAMDKLSPVLQHNILKSSKRYQYIASKLEEIIAQAVYIMSEQTRQSEFSPLKVELGFGLDKKGLAPLTIPLENGYDLLLRGRIDRVDQATINDELYLRIVDYKSSAQGLSLVNVYYGLSLQMLAYLHVMLLQAQKDLQLEKTPLPGGMLYFHIKDILLNEKGPISDQEIAEEIMKQYQMKGFITKKEDVAIAMDENVAQSTSQIIPARLKKKGGFYAYSSVLSDESIDLLRQHVEHLFIEAGLEITSGDIKLNPFENEHMNACTYCDFKSLCQFDPILKENNYHRIDNLKDEEALEKIKTYYEKGV